MLINSSSFSSATNVSQKMVDRWLPLVEIESHHIGVEEHGVAPSRTKHLGKPYGEYTAGLAQDREKILSFLGEDPCGMKKPSPRKQRGSTHVIVHVKDQAKYLNLLVEVAST
jgi:hypothetical protein